MKSLLYAFPISLGDEFCVVILPFLLLDDDGFVLLCVGAVLGITGLVTCSDFTVTVQEASLPFCDLQVMLATPDL